MTFPYHFVIDSGPQSISNFYFSRFSMTINNTWGNFFKKKIIFLTEFSVFLQYQSTHLLGAGTHNKKKLEYLFDSCKWQKWMDKVILITSRWHHQQNKFLLLDILLIIPEPPHCIMAYSASLFFIVDPFLFKKN